jgi:hypothetical protein
VAERIERRDPAYQAAAWPPPILRRCCLLTRRQTSRRTICPVSQQVAALLRQNAADARWEIRVRYPGSITGGPGFPPST